MQKRKRFTPERMAFLSLFVALQIVLGNLVQIPLLEKQFNLGFLPIALAGWLFGPVAGMIVGGLGDFFGAHIFPAGAYFFGFTLSNLIVGFLYGFILYKHKPCFWRGGAAVLAVSVCYLFLNSYWLNIIVPTRSYWVWVGLRWWTYLIEVPFNAIVLHGVAMAVGKWGHQIPGLREHVKSLGTAQAEHTPVPEEKE